MAVSRTSGLRRVRLLAALAGVVALTQTAPAAEPVDIAVWVAHWPASYAVSGTKNEPTYLEAIDLQRRGDAFTIVGGAPAWETRSTEAIAVSPAGALRHTICPAGMNCNDRIAPSGFLAGAALLGAARRGVPLGTATPVAYGRRTVLCVAGERIGIAHPILDPCFDLATGAVLAQRHRLSGAFDGPSLDPWSIEVRPGASPVLSEGRTGS